MAYIYIYMYILQYHFFLTSGEACELVERAVDGERGGMEQSCPAKA